MTLKYAMKLLHWYVFVLYRRNVFTVTKLHRFYNEIRYIEYCAHKSPVALNNTENQNMRCSNVQIFRVPTFRWNSKSEARVARYKL